MLCSCEPFYSIDGNVVDVNTLQPISGVEIRMNYSLGGYPGYPYHSDSTGHFHIITHSRKNINITYRKEGYEPVNTFYRKIKKTYPGFPNPTIIKLHKISNDSLLLQESDKTK